MRVAKGVRPGIIRVASIVVDLVMSVVWHGSQQRIHHDGDLAQDGSLGTDGHGGRTILGLMESLAKLRRSRSRAGR